MAEYTFPELVDIRQLQSLMELFHKATGMPAAIVDVDSTIHVATGWQDICTKFHRVHPVTEARCRESDDYIKSCSNEEGYISYKCRNGLWDLAVPIRIAGEHVASFFCGQLFYEDQPPDYEY
ncbi:MAG: PocR ligand-binding domain-containing protein, partial [Gemmatimonadota bacterium]|nr:PocR ligand-binding domain-containing protein [Gemmatimonadota bacterium]